MSHAKRKKRHHGSRLVPPGPAEQGRAPGYLPTGGTGQIPNIQVITYGPDDVEEFQPATTAELRAIATKHAVTWINVDGVDHSDTLRELGEVFGLHPLALEDSFNIRQRPKVEDYGSHLYVVLRMPSLNENGELALEQVSLFLLPGVVITVQEHPGDCLEIVRKRIRTKTGRIRRAEADYLGYSLIDAIVDSYYPILERYGDKLEELEERLLVDTNANENTAIHALKQDLSIIRRALWPLRETLSTLARDSEDHINAETRTFFRDCLDHTMQLMDIVEACREMGASLRDLYLATLSQRMNEIMKVLTLIATIFIPLGFIAGVYGMNFDRASSWNMPELGWAHGYPFALGLMATTVLIFLGYFRHKGWLGGKKGRSSPV
jgi:magnesium transporter